MQGVEVQPLAVVKVRGAVEGEERDFQHRSRRTSKMRAQKAHHVCQTWNLLKP